MQTALNIFKAAGLKSTASRLAVVTLLAQNNYPHTHQDLLKQLPESFDRVTLYRVLDWLLKHQLIHRIAGDDRAWRFQLNTHLVEKSNAGTTYSPSTSLNKAIRSKQTLQKHTHAHFQCHVCSKVFCLEDVQPKLSSSIPAHFTVDSIELNIKGKCADCQS